MPRLPLMISGALLIGALASPGLQAQSPDPAGFAPGPGVETVQTRCAACHPATMITSKRFTAEKWGEVVDQMISKGAQVTDADYDVIVAYLAKTYGADK